MQKLPTTTSFALLICFAAFWPAQAQMTIDVSKITCDQFRTYKVTNPNYIAIWIDGFLSSKRDTTTVDVGSFKENFDKLNDYCITHLNDPVMQAAKTILAK